MKLVSTTTSILTALALGLSSAAYAANRDGGKNSDGRNTDRDHRNKEFWPQHENGCAIGNDPPPGANCTNRDERY